MSTVSGSGVSINKDKLAKWNFLRQAKYSKDADGVLELNKDKLSFLNTFCEKVHRNSESGNLGPGHLFFCKAYNRRFFGQDTVEVEVETAMSEASRKAECWWAEKVDRRTKRK